jgi:long-chain-fatty-acid---luciferin-component ligase
VAADLTTLTGNVEAVIGNLSLAMRSPAANRDALRVELVRQSVAFHYQANPLFHRQCELQHLTPDRLLTVADLRRIPLTPVPNFKTSDASRLLSVSLDDIDIEIQSTGTGGIPSVARRDGVTTTRACLALRESVRYTSGTKLG